MAVVSALAVGLGGALGAAARFAIGRVIERRGLDTLAVNVVGSGLLGVVLAAGLGDRTVLFAGVGFCGAFTTFSSFAVETVRLAEGDGVVVAAIYAAGTLALAGLALAGGTMAAGGF